MTLDQWLTKTGMLEREFGLRIGRAQATVNRYRSGKQIPRRPDMIAIYLVTNRQVTPNDFYDLPPLELSSKAPEEAAA